MRLPDPQHLSGTEAAAAAAISCRSLLKGLCPQPDFCIDGPPCSEYQCLIGCSGGTRDIRWDTELE